MDNIISSLEKKIVGRLISSSEISSHSIINIHQLKTENCGDLLSAPYLYFKELSLYDKLDITEYISYNFLNSFTWVNKVRNNDIVLGGGGLFDRESFSHSIEMLNLLLKKGKKIVPWGVGHNNPSLEASKIFYHQIKDFEVIGIRDYGIKGTDWVPCVSCMNSIFDNKFKTEREIGIVEHEYIKISNNALDFPTISNVNSFEKMVSFIGSCEILITNSYHAMYWGMLLNKKVVVVPNSSKMSSFKYPAVQCFDLSNLDSSIKKAISYSGLLEECRGININFSRKVFNYLNI